MPSKPSEYTTRKTERCHDVRSLQILANVPPAAQKLSQSQIPFKILGIAQPAAQEAVMWSDPFMP